MVAFNVLERTTRLYTITLDDENGLPFNCLAFLTLQLTLYDCLTDTIINGRNVQNILNQANVTVAVGFVQWHMQDIDNIIVTPTMPDELHRALFTGTWNPGAGVCTWRHEAEFMVRNLHRVP